MRGFEVVAGVIVAFFVIGIVVGGLIVIALPALRRRLRRDPRDISWEGEYRRRYGLPPGYDDNDGPPWPQSPRPDDDEEGPPTWPGRRG